jgi:hypothetical protein
MRVKAWDVLGQALRQQKSVKEVVAELGAFTSALISSA